MQTIRTIAKMQKVARQLAGKKDSIALVPTMGFLHEGHQALIRRAKKEADVVIIFIGVNDVWHKQMGTGTDAEKFARFYQAVINKIKIKGSKMILCTPAAIGERTDFSNALDGDLNYYSNMIRDLAKKNNLPIIDLRKDFLAYNLLHNKENKESGILTADRVHLNAKGNLLVAQQMWEAIKAL